MSFVEKNKKIFFILVIPVFIVLLNLYIIYPIFQGEFNKNISSIEVAFFTDAKFISDHFPHLSWNPHWYVGFPFRNVYPPFLPFSIAFLHNIFSSISWAQFYRILMGVFYMIGPACLYFFVRYLTKRNLAAFFAALGYSILPSFSYFFGNTASYGEMANMGSLRLVVLQVFGEGPHVAALALIPLAALLFLRAVREPTLKKKILAASAVALVALINWIGFVALVIILAITWFSEIFRGEAGKKAKNAFIILLGSYGLMAFWFNLTFLKSSIGFGSGSRGEGDILGNYLKILPILPVVIPLIVAINWLIAKKLKKVRGLLLAFLWLVIFLFVTLSWYYWETAFIPQPPRFMPEVNMGAFILLGIILDLIYQKISGLRQKEKKKKKSRLLAGGIYAIIVIILIFIFSWNFLSQPRDLLDSHHNIKDTYPYQVADFLKNKVDKNERVFATANVAFWLNYFTDIQQIKGAADPAATHPWWDHALYQICTGENAPNGKSGEMAHLWLKSLNANYIIVNGPGSQDPFHDYKDPEKFEIFDSIYEKNGDIVYEVPLINPSLAQVADERDYYALEEPAGGVDYDRIKKYAEWVEEPTKPKASFNWVNNDQFEIEAKVEQGEVISVQITYDKGWQVKDENRYLRTEKDPIGNLVIFPKTFGKIKVTGEHKKTYDIWLGYLITLTTVILIIWQIIKVRRKNGKTNRKKEQKITREE